MCIMTPSSFYVYVLRTDLLNHDREYRSVVVMCHQTFKQLSVSSQTYENTRGTGPRVAGSWIHISSRIVFYGTRYYSSTPVPSRECRMHT